MADNTPVSNVVNIKIANYLDDPLTAAADNGLTAATNTSMFLAAQRNQALNEALAWIVQELVNRVGPDMASQACQGAVATQAITFAAAGSTVNKDFMYPLRLISTGKPLFTLMSKSDLDADQDFLITRAYTIEGGKLYGYIRSAGTLTLQSSGTATFYYLKADRKNTTTGADVVVNTAPDTTLDFRFMDSVTWYACHLLAQAKGAGEWLEKNAQFMKLALEKFPK